VIAGKSMPIINHRFVFRIYNQPPRSVMLLLI
jgi:hypothetical protein